MEKYERWSSLLFDFLLLSTVEGKKIGAATKCQLGPFTLIMLIIQCNVQFGIVLVFYVAVFFSQLLFSGMLFFLLAEQIRSEI